jgi:two-component system LytT family response regulator
MRAIIVDDEPLARRGIVQLLADHADVEIVAECANGIEAAEMIKTSSPGLVFLDVQMPEMDGFDVVRRVGVESMPSVVFITAYDEFAVQAFEASAVDYLMKPVGPERFAAAMTRVRARRREKAALRQVAELRALLTHVEPAAAPLVVTTVKGAVRIDPAEIDWIGADDYYAVIHVGDKHYLLRESLTSLEERLPKNAFIRVHRSAIVNCRSVRELRRGALILRDGTRIVTSRRKRAAVTSALKATASQWLQRHTSVIL